MRKFEKMEDSVASLSILPGASPDEVRPYKVHVSSKYLTLTQRKLELTRLPHELLLPKEREWEDGTPKGAVEPLIDFWLEEYSWRNREAYFNERLPQYRTIIAIPSLSGEDAPPISLRIHFIHVPSTSPSAIPLLIIPPFPLTNLSLLPLLHTFSGTTDFHLIIPSLPGLGFSDALLTAPFSPIAGTSTGRGGILTTTTNILNTIMLRLSYTHYLVSSTGSGLISPAHIDYHLPRLLALNHPENCRGVHLLDPPVDKPIFAKGIGSWMKWGVAKFFHAGVWGYESGDWRAYTGTAEATKPTPAAATPRTNSNIAEEVDLEAQTHNQESEPQRSSKSESTSTTVGLHRSGKSSTALFVPFLLPTPQPNTLAYALCDSPIGLLSLVLASLRYISPTNTISHSQTEIIDIAQLAWLPGPEGALRFWGGAGKEIAAERASKLRGVDKAVGRRRQAKPTLTVVTNFVDDGVCRPVAWLGGGGEQEFEVVGSQRSKGLGGPGVVIWEEERRKVFLVGVTKLGAEVRKRVPGIWEAGEASGVTAGGLVVEEGVEDGGAVVEGMGEMSHAVVGFGEGVEGGVLQEGETQMDVESPDTVILARQL